MPGAPVQPLISCAALSAQRFEHMALKTQMIFDLGSLTFDQDLTDKTQTRKARAATVL
jgi:hypothetical protein